jgi:hypothetical protein
LANAIADIFRQAAQANRDDPRRHGNLVRIDAPWSILVSGDIHGHRANLIKIIDYAALGQHPDRLLVLQEIIHGPTDERTGQDRSIELLMRAARLKLAHPQNVLFLLGNHDVAQLTGNEITKEGRGVCNAFNQALAGAFGEDCPEIVSAVEEFLQSLPLAIRCSNGALLSHSLPSPGRMELAGTAILDQAGYQADDFKRGNAVYEWTWGRGQTPEQLDALAGTLGVEFFVGGHRHSGLGYEMIPGRGISIASDNENGCLLEFPGETKLTMDNVMNFLKPIRTLSK